MLVNHSSYHIFGSGSASHYSRVLRGESVITLTDAARLGLIVVGATYDDGGNGFVGFVDADVWALVPGLRVRCRHWADPGRRDHAVVYDLPLARAANIVADDTYAALAAIVYARREGWHITASILADRLVELGEPELEAHFRVLAAAEDSRLAESRRIRDEIATGESQYRASHAVAVSLVERHGGTYWMPPSGRDTFSVGFLCGIPEEHKSAFCREAHRLGLSVSRYTPGIGPGFCYRIT